ncbi:MAG TPA: hypothetical protein DEA08_29260, partial [Planctomycetes bacterium]|nr:hypothetical protein [Planctomycetota bacterium]
VSGVQVARQPSAEGDDSTIYQGRELSGGAWVSVEVLRHQELEQDDLGRLRAFAQELGGLEHPGLPRLVRYVDEPGQRALVWSQLAGEPLSERLAHRGPCPWQDALPLLRRVAAACAAAHWAGVPHGDLRAERVLVSERGVQLRWPLPARSVEGGGPLPRPDLPRLGRLPPELVEDVRVRSLPSDVYQFAALCVQVLAGRSLFSGDSVRTVLRAVLDPVRMPELGSLRGLAPQPMIELIRRSVAKEPALRPGSLVEVLATLQLFA